MIPIEKEPILTRNIFSDKVGFSFLNNAINVWTVSTDCSPLLFDLCNEALTDKEQGKISFFKFEKVQKNYIISQGCLRLLLSKYCNISPRNITIGRHRKGKPFSLDNPKLRFNMSNSGKKVIYCFSEKEELGIDLEKIRFLPDLDDLIDKNFTSDEKKYIFKLKKEKSSRFFKFWTVKEAYLKAIGVGMRLPPDNLEFSIKNGAYRLESIKGISETEDWVFKNLNCGDDYKGTLVYKNKGSNILKMSIE